GDDRELAGEFVDLVLPRRRTVADVAVQQNEGRTLACHLVCDPQPRDLYMFPPCFASRGAHVSSLAQIPGRPGAIEGDGPPVQCGGEAARRRPIWRTRWGYRATRCDYTCSHPPFRSGQTDLQSP